jgi:hypothetical protein
MYLFSRSRTAHPARFPEAVGAAGELGRKAAGITGLDISAWTSVMSPDAGRIVWTTFFESLADWEAASDKLAVDAGFAEMVRQSDDLFVGPLEDGMVTLLTPLPEQTGEQMNYVAVVSAKLANGRYSEGIAQGLALAEAATRIGGVPTMFAIANTGPYGSVEWFSAASDISTLEASEHAVNGDPSFVKMVDEAGPCFQPDALQAIYRRIA